MKKALAALGILVGLGAITFAAGPRAASDVTLQPVDLPADLDGYIAQKEAAVEGLRPGTERAIIWADAARQRTPYSIVYIHGFGATRGETYPLSDSLAHRIGANLHYARLTGHGQEGPDPMGEATITDWVNDVNEAYRIGQQIGERVILIGTSMGGALTTWFAAQPEAADLFALVLISPAYGIRDADSENSLRTVAGLPWARRIVRAVIGERWSTLTGDANRDYYWSRDYRSDALVAFIKAVDLGVGVDHAQITAPTLMIYSPDDVVISPSNIERIYPALGANRKDSVQVLNSTDQYDHVIAGDYMSPNTTAQVEAEILAFLTPLMADQ
ncbi:MAG: alpha/beta fold hydrolase [Bacteroidota bacterium]